MRKMLDEKPKAKYFVDLFGGGGSMSFTALQIDRRRLAELKRLQPLNNLTLTTLDYKEVKIKTPIDETIIYLDPPYRGTAKYIEGVSHDEIDDYFKSSPYTCFMSEYKAPFKSILKIKKAQLLDNTKEKKTYALEQLYINK